MRVLVRGLGITTRHTAESDVMLNLTVDAN